MQEKDIKIFSFTQDVLNLLTGRKFDIRQKDACQVHMIITYGICLYFFLYCVNCYIALDRYSPFFFKMF